MPEGNWQAQVDTFIEHFTSKRTQQRYAAALKEFQQWYEETYGEEPTLERLTDQNLRKWRETLVKRGLKPATVNLRLSAVRSFARSQGQEDLRVQNVSEVSKPVEPLKPGQVGKLLRALDGDRWERKRDVAIVSLLAGAGLRVSEVVHLQMDDVQISERKGTARIRQGKGMKEREVRLGANVRAALREYLDVRPDTPCHSLFLSRNEKPLHARDVQRVVQRGAHMARLDDELDVTPHTLRHSYASRFIVRNPGQIGTLQMQLGHRSLRSTWRYMHPTGAEVQEMVEDLWEKE